jgi:hypothetical protein
VLLDGYVQGVSRGENLSCGNQAFQFGRVEVGVVDFRGDQSVAGITERAVELVGLDGLGVVALEAVELDFLVMSE